MLHCCSEGKNKCSWNYDYYIEVYGARCGMKSTKMAPKIPATPCTLPV